MAKRKKGKVVQMLSPENYIKQKARTLPILECWVNTDWEETGLADITVSRKHSNGNITVGMYLIDLKCLGVKDTQYFFNMSPFEYRDLLDRQREVMKLENLDYTLAHNIVFAGIEYADDYGFKPQKDFRVTQYILEEDTDDIELIEIECGGKDGNPFYLRGPLDNDVRAAQIITQLEKTAGPGNFTFVDGRLDDEWEDGLFNDYSESPDDNREDQEIFEERLSKLSKKQKLETLLDYLRRMEELTEEENRDLTILTNMAIEDHIDAEKADRYYQNFSDRLDEIEITDEATDEFFEGLGIEAGLLPMLKRDFNEAEAFISKGSKKAGSILKAIKSNYPENAATRYLELFFLHSKNSKKFETFLEESIQLYPTFPLIGLFWRINEIIRKNNTFEDIDIRNALQTFFPFRKTIHVSELFYLFLYLVNQANQTNTIEHIEALSDLIDEAVLPDEDLQIIKELNVTGKLAYVVSLFQKYNLK